MGQSITLGGTAYSFSTAYTDAGEPTSLTYSDGEVATYGYDAASGALISLITQPAGGGATNLLLGVTYNANGTPTGASVGNGVYTNSASYDLDARLSSLSMLTTSTNTTDFASSRTYDAVGNVQLLATTLSGGTSNQAFCYDEQNRVSWTDGQAGTGPCGVSLTTGTLTSYGPGTVTYDVLDRMATTASGTNVFGDSHHIHALTSMGGGYSASYDAAGNMTCRSTSSSNDCTTSAQNGQIMSYDSAGRMTSWQNAPSSPIASPHPRLAHMLRDAMLSGEILQSDA